MASLRVGPYALEAPIGRGGMAEVFRARAPDGRAVVVKRMLPELAADADFRAMLEDEARHVRALRHPGIVPVVDDGVDGGVPYLVLELVDGPDLGTILRRTGALPHAAVAQVGADVAAALAHAHAAGVVHRVVTPGNVLVDKSGRARLVDFGIARAASGRSVTLHGTVKGKPGYLAPEQALGGTVDGRTDLYALGVTLAEALTGRPLFEGQGPAEAAARLGKRAADVAFPDATPRAMRALVLECLEPDPAARPREAGEVAKKLASFAQEDGPRLLADAALRAALAQTLPLPAAAAPAAVTGVVVPRREPRSRASLRWPLVFALGLGVAALLGYRAGVSDRASPRTVTVAVPVPAPTPAPVADPVVDPGPAPAPVPASARPRPAKRMGTLRLEAVPRAIVLRVDGRRYEHPERDVSIRLTAGKHLVEIETPRGEVFDHEVEVPANGEERIRIPGRRRRHRGGDWR